MAILAGALQPDAGSDGDRRPPYAPRSPIEARRAGVAMIHQELSLAPHLSVMENILLGVEPTRFGLVRPAADGATIATRALAELGHDDIAPDAHRRHAPSPAQQLVEIARAIAVGCRVLVLDEPTSSLGRDDVRAAVRAAAPPARRRGHAIVYISHFIEEVKEIADRFVVLRDGRNAGGGPTAGRDARRHRRADGRRPARRAVSRGRRGAGRGHPDRRRARAGRIGVVHAAPRRDLRHRRPDRRRTDAPAADALRSRAGDERDASASASTAAPATPHDRVAGRAWACSARTARTKGSPSA